MAALTPRARALVQAGRDGFRPADADRSRIEGALEARLPGAFPPDAPGAGGPSVAPPAAAGWLAPGLAVGICVLAGAGFFVTLLAVSDGSRAAPVAPAPAAVTMTPSVSMPVTENPGLEGEPVAAAPPVATEKAETHAPAAPRSKDRLAEEVLLLSRATSALRAGRAADALRALDEHQRRFPNGALREERSAARAQALCASRRVIEGRAELARLAAGSPAAVRARQVCDASAAASKER